MATERDKCQAAALLPPDHIIFGRSAAMQEIRHTAEKLSRTNVPILLYGPGGSGKETLACWIHAHSSYSGGQFVKVNCAAIPGSLLESELFGYEKGAFSGAQVAKPGRLERAHQGTLYLDEIADLEPALQGKLLDFLQDGSFSRIGDQTNRNVETRVICATHRDLELAVQARRFRADLYYRINVVQLKLPKLEARREDIPELAHYFRQSYQEEFAKDSPPLSQQQLAYLQNSQWSGDMRELSNFIARYVLMGPEAFGEPADGQQSMRNRAGTNKIGSVPLKLLARDAIRELERSVILKALRANRWNRRQTAKDLRISYRALIYKIRNAGLVCKSTELASGPHADEPNSPDCHVKMQSGK